MGTPPIRSPRLLPLTMLVMLLLLIAKAATFAKDAGAALGLESQAATPAAQSAPAQTGALALSLPVAAAPPEVAIDPKERALLKDLRKRREALDVREHALEERNAVLEAAEIRLQSKIDELAALQSKLADLDVARKQRQDQNWGGLVKVYEDMKPRDAAAIFDVLDMHVLLQVLDRMNERKAAAVLAAMQPERARLATQMLAQMRLRQDLVTAQGPADAQAGLKTAQ